eukprot:3635973-Rhodomonas_salina.1
MATAKRPVVPKLDNLEVLGKEKVEPKGFHVAIQNLGLRQWDGEVFRLVQQTPRDRLDEKGDNNSPSRLPRKKLGLNRELLDEKVFALSRNTSTEDMKEDEDDDDVPAPLRREPTVQFCSFQCDIPRTVPEDSHSSAEPEGFNDPDLVPVLRREPTVQFCTAECNFPRALSPDSQCPTVYEGFNDPDLCPPPLVREPSKNPSALLHKKLAKKAREAFIARGDLEIGAAALPRFSFSAAAASRILKERDPSFPAQLYTPRGERTEAPSAACPTSREKVGKLSVQASDSPSVSIAPTCMIDTAMLSAESTPRRASVGSSVGPSGDSCGIGISMPPNAMLFETPTPLPQKAKNRGNKQEVIPKAVQEAITRISEQSCQTIAVGGDHKLDTR